jgi:hypothetical protein
MPAARLRRLAAATVVDGLRDPREGAVRTSLAWAGSGRGRSGMTGLEGNLADPGVRFVIIASLTRLIATS